MPDPITIQNDHILLSLKAVSSFWLVIVKRKNGYRIKNVMANIRKNHVFHIGDSMSLIMFKSLKILI